MTRALAWVHGLSLGACAAAYFCGAYTDALTLTPVVACTAWALVLGDSLGDVC